MVITCHAHGDFLQPPQDHLQGHGCPYCAKTASISKRKKDPLSVLLALQKTHPSLHFPGFLQVFQKTVEKIQVVCPSHGAFLASPHHLLKGKGCRRCGLERSAASRRVSEDEFIARATLRHAGAYSYSRLAYTGYASPVTITCPLHGDFTMKPDTHLNQGSGCLQCAVERRSADRITPFEEFLKRARDEHGDAYEYLETSYTKLSSPVTIICHKHGAFNQLPFDHLSGSNCPRCAGVGSSKPQEAMAGFLREYGVDLIENFRYGVGKKEVDIFIPSRMLAIEFNGIYFHSSKFKAPSAHLAKHLELQTLGIRLIQIFEDEWVFRSGQVRSLLLTASGVMPVTGHARSGTMTLITQDEADEFYTNNHIQGSIQGGTHAGLLSGKTLSAVMTFTKRHSHRGYSSSGSLELARFASFGRIPGAASRLFSFLLRTTGALSVVSYSDNRLFSGGMYSALGFQKVHVTPPSYTYITPGTLKPRLHKSRFRHSQLPTLLGEEYDPSKSERENCEANNYWRVYDCGLTRWQFDR